MEGDEEPQWLDGDEQRAWLALASLTVRLPSALDARMQREAGITHFEYVVMAVLSMSPEHTLRMSELAEYADSSLSRLSNVAARLEKRGWLHRYPDPEDGRWTLATLTRDGLKQVTDAAPGHVGEVRRLIFDAITPTQRRQLTEICQRILTRIDPDSGATDRRARALLGDKASAARTPRTRRR